MNIFGKHSKLLSKYHKKMDLSYSEYRLIASEYHQKISSKRKNFCAHLKRVNGVGSEKEVRDFEKKNPTSSVN